jgi:hypothetical protein
LCGLAWADVRIDDLDDAEVDFGWQVDRHGNRRPTKTDGSALLSRSLDSLLSSSAVISSRRGTAARPISCSRRPQEEHSSSATSPVLCGRRRLERWTRTDTRCSRFFTRRTPEHGLG